MDNINEDKKSFYSIIPAYVRYDNELCPNAKLMYGEISALSNEKGYCYAKNIYFSRLYDVNERTIIRWLNQLKNKKYIQIILKNNYKRKIYINSALSHDKNVMPPRQKCHGKNNITNNNVPLLHKGTEGAKNAPPEKKKKRFEPNKNEIALMDYWNSLEHVRVHKPKYKRYGKVLDSKTYIEACKMIRRIKDGTLFKKCKLDPTHLRTQNIKRLLIEGEYADPEIRKIFKRMSLYYLKGYPPLDKNKLPKSLTSLIYNSLSGTSHFLMAAASRPKPFKNTLHTKPRNKEIHEKYQRVFEECLANVKDEEKLTIKVNLIYSFFEKKIKKIFKDDKYWRSYFKTPRPLLEEHIKWLSKKRNVYLSYLEIENQMFRNFLIHLKKLHHNAWNFLDEKEQKKGSMEKEFSHITDKIY